MNHTHIPSIVYVCLLSVGVYCKWHSMVVNHQQKSKQSPYCECNHISHEAGHHSTQAPTEEIQLF